MSCAGGLLYAGGRYVSWCDHFGKLWGQRPLKGGDAECIWAVEGRTEVFSDGGGGVKQRGLGGQRNAWEAVTLFRNLADCHSGQCGENLGKFTQQYIFDLCPFLHVILQ